MRIRSSDSHTDAENSRQTSSSTFPGTSRGAGMSRFSRSRTAASVAGSLLSFGIQFFKEPPFCRPKPEEIPDCHLRHLYICILLRTLAVNCMYGVRHDRARRATIRSVPPIHSDRGEVLVFGVLKNLLDFARRIPAVSLLNYCSSLSRTST